MKNQETKFPSADALGKNVVTQNGSFSREEFFFSGKRPDLGQFGGISFVSGFSGIETKVVRDKIVPKGVVEVR